MCGRFKRKSDKQKVMRVFEVQAGLEETDFAPGDDLRPQAMQPVSEVEGAWREVVIEVEADVGSHGGEGLVGKRMKVVG